MRQRCGVQLSPIHAPPGQVLVEQRDEMLVVATFMKMGEFVDDDVFHALHWLLHEFKVQPDSPGVGVAGAPSRFHPLDAPRRCLNAEQAFPFLDERRDQLLEFPPIPALQRTTPLTFVRTCRGLLFYRLIEQALAIPPVRCQTLVGGTEPQGIGVGGTM